MKKIYSMIMVAALLVAGVAMTGCKNNNDVQEPAKVQTYQMSINASKGADNQANGPKKVLGLDGNTLNASWAVGEQVTVYNVTKSAELGGYLEAQTAGANTTLLGTLTGTIEANDVLTLKFLSPSYAAQDGTLEYISANCDYATASVTVSSVSGSTIYTEGTANFVNQQAIVKFTLMKKDDSAIELPAATALTVNDGTNTYTVTPGSATDVLFVAIPATNTVHLSTSFGGVTYSYDKTATDLLAAGQYYEIGVKMWREVNLAGISANTTLVNGDKAYGTIGGNYKISIADGATVNLYNATITYASNGADWAGLTCLGDATIVLGDGTTNTVVGGLDGDGYSNWSGIFIPAGSTLTINGNTGVLNARRGGDDVEDGSPAGIGASWKNPCGNIVINGGVINAEGGAQAAGIGGCCWRGCGDITINGGTVTATGHIYGTGIGLGGTHNANSITSLSGGNITITGGTVIATGGEGGAGIGTGFSDHKSGNTMTITLGNILISGGTVTAIGGFEGAGIGTGLSYDVNSNSCGDITITGGTVTATGGYRAAGIGAGYQNGSALNQCGDITITSGVTRVTATRGDVADNCIGHGRNSTCGTVTVGGVVGAISTSPYTYEP